MDFIVAGLPRSGTAWASVWLTSGNAICLHEPLARRTPQELSALHLDGYWGISCTGIWIVPGLIDAQNCPVVTLSNGAGQVNLSLRAMGLQPLPDRLMERFEALKYPAFSRADMLEDRDKAAEMWAILRPDAPFDPVRWELLRRMKIEADMSKFTVAPRSLEAMCDASA